MEIFIHKIKQCNKYSTLIILDSHYNIDNSATVRIKLLESSIVEDDTAFLAKLLDRDTLGVEKFNGILSKQRRHLNHSQKGKLYKYPILNTQMCMNHKFVKLDMFPYSL